MDDATTLDELIAQEPGVSGEQANAGEPAEQPGPESEVATLRAMLATRNEEQATMLARLRETLLERDPAIDAAMVHGDTLEELETSFAAAIAVVERVREGVRRERAAVIPAGAPGRHGAAPKTAFEKIRAGLAGR